LGWFAHRIEDLDETLDVIANPLALGLERLGQPLIVRVRSEGLVGFDHPVFGEVDVAQFVLEQLL
jgi:hypothetical protein